MLSLNSKFIRSLNFSYSHLAILRKVGECRGTQDLFSDRAKEALSVLKKHAIIESVESSNRLEQITAPHPVIRDLVIKSTAPKNRSEREIASYRDALNLIHDSYPHMELSVNVIKQLHTTIYRYLPEDGGEFKPTDNKIIETDPSGAERDIFAPVSAMRTPMMMDDLCKNYNSLLDNSDTEPLILFPLLILDFLCIHPFKDGNGRIARLLTLLVLLRQGYKVGQYISIERIHEESKERYYATLRASSQQWHEARHNPFPWMEYFWGVLIKAHKELEEKVAIIRETGNAKGFKKAQIELSVKHKVGPFSISSVEEDCPGISRDMIRVVLRQLRDKGAIYSQGIGRGATWQSNPAAARARE